MIRDVDARKHELLFDFKEKYENNENVIEFNREINTLYTMITYEAENLDPDDDRQVRALVERLEYLNGKINDNLKLIPARVETGIKFTKNPTIGIKIPYIGDINYDSIYKIDVISKIKNFNNSFQQRVIDLNKVIEKDPITKHIGMISKNKIFVIFEKIYGKVKTSFAKIIYFDETPLAEIEIKNVGSLTTYAIHDKFILLVFKKGKKSLSFKCTILI